MNLENKDLYKKNLQLKAEADQFLDDLGLGKLIKEYGDYKIDGSYAYDIMVWRDLDIVVDSSKMSLAKIHELISRINAKFNPFWFMGKEDITEEGTTCFFIGFETKILSGITWNFDIWFRDAAGVNKVLNYHNWLIGNLESYPVIKERVLQIKTDVFRTKEYGSKFFSIDVYKAVIEDGVKSTEQYYKWIEKAK